MAIRAMCKYFTLLTLCEQQNGQSLLHFCSKIYVPDRKDLHWWIVSQHHDTQVAEHAGRWKILKSVVQNYWWLQMSHYIGQYVKTCDLCLHTKVQQHPPVRELSLLPIPESHWDTISVDFIVELPESHGYDAIMNVVDSVSKLSHFILTHNNHHPWCHPLIPCTHMEVAWTSKTGHFQLRSVVCSRADMRALPRPWHKAGCHYGLPSIGWWADGAGQPGGGTISPSLCQWEAGL